MNIISSERFLRKHIQTIENNYTYFWLRPINHYKKVKKEKGVKTTLMYNLQTQQARRNSSSPSMAAQNPSNKDEILLKEEAVTTVIQKPVAVPHDLAEKRNKIPLSLVSFKEESNKLADLSLDQRRALDEFKLLLQEALKNNRLFLDAEASDEVSIWGVPLLKDERSDVILLKFLRARDFDVKDAYVMLSKTIKWRRDFKVDESLKEDLGDDLEKVVFMHGHDKEGHPVCYNVYGEFQNKELYINTFGDEDRRLRFLRWRIQFLERSIRNLDFTPGGINTIFQVSDLKNSPGPGKKELRIATKQALQILQDNYPEFVAKQVESNAICF